MFKKYIFFLLSLIVIDLSFFPAKAIKNKIIVKIDNNIITDYELKNKLKTSLILSNQEINQINIDKNKRRALLYLIDLKLKTNELSKYKVEVDKLNVRNQLLPLPIHLPFGIPDESQRINKFLLFSNLFQKCMTLHLSPIF